MSINLVISGMFSFIVIWSSCKRLGNIIIPSSSYSDAMKETHQAQWLWCFLAKKSARAFQYYIWVYIYDFFRHLSFVLKCLLHDFSFALQLTISYISRILRDLSSNRRKKIFCAFFLIFHSPHTINKQMPFCHKAINCLSQKYFFVGKFSHLSQNNFFY